MVKCIKLEVKICSKCGKEKKLRYFSYRKDTNKYRNQCRNCAKGYKSNRIDRVKQVDDYINKGLKRCGKCSKIKSLDNFNKDRTTRTGYTSRCKSCVKEYNLKTIDERRKRTAMSRYNISSKSYDLLMTKDSCMICNIEFNDDIYRVIDHCHSTGKVRGVLCFSCNTGLGHLKDNVDNLKSAINYLNNKTTNYE